MDLVLAPTPLHPAPRLSRELGVPVLFKRDDLAGVGLGGNKLRGLEYLIADALAQGCDSLVTGAGPQSNWTMLAALACLRYGLEAHVVCYGSGEGEPQGNMRLHRWLGVDVRFTGEAERSSVDAGIAAVTGELRAAGRRPYPVPRGGATPLGALGYVRASLELAAQLADMDERPAGLWLATGSCGTQAGLVAGAAVTGASYRVVGVTVSRPAGEAADRVRELAAAAVALARTGAEPAATGAALAALAPPREDERHAPRAGRAHRVDRAGLRCPVRRGAGRGAARRGDRGRVPGPGVRGQGDGRADRRVPRGPGARPPGVPGQRGRAHTVRGGRTHPR